MTDMNDLVDEESELSSEDLLHEMEKMLRTTLDVSAADATIPSDTTEMLLRQWAVLTQEGMRRLLPLEQGLKELLKSTKSPHSIALMRAAFGGGDGPQMPPEALADDVAVAVSLGKRKDEEEQMDEDDIQAASNDKLKNLLHDAFQDSSRRDVEVDKMASDGNMSMVWDKMGRAHEGVSMHLHDWQGHPMEHHLFLAPTGWTSAEGIEGKIKEASGEQADGLVASMRLDPWSFAKKVAFCWKEEDGWHVSQPMRIQHKTAQNGSLRLTCSTDLGRRVDYQPSESLHAMVSDGRLAMTFQNGEYKAAQMGIGEDPNTQQTVRVPAHYIPIAVDVDRFESVDGHLVKLGFGARRRQDRPAPVHIIGDAGQWRVEHPAMKTASFDSTTLPVFLASIGMMPHDQDRVMEKLSGRGEVSLFDTGVLDALEQPTQAPQRSLVHPREGAKVAEFIHKNAGAWWQLATDVSKMAAQVDGEAASQMTDTGMSLALAEEDQVGQIAQALPKIEEVLQYCAQILVLARKGELTIVPDVVRNAMQALDALTENLTALTEAKDETQMME